MRRVAVLLSVVVLCLVTSVQAKNNLARAALDKVLPEAKFINIPIVDVINFIHDTSGANIVVDWKALESVNISKDTQINMNVHQVRLEKVLSLVLNEAAPGDILTYYTDQNVIHVTTHAVADSKLITIVYYVEDIIDQDLPFDPTINVGGGNFTQGNSSTVGTGQNVGGSGGQQGGLFGSNNQQSSNNGNKNPAQDKADRAKALIATIEKTVRPEVWKDNGGNSVIEYYNGNIIVSAPRSVQELIGGPVD